MTLNKKSNNITNVIKLPIIVITIVMIIVSFNLNKKTLNTKQIQNYQETSLLQLPDHWKDDTDKRNDAYSPVVITQTIVIDNVRYTFGMYKNKEYIFSNGNVLALQ